MKNMENHIFSKVYSIDNAQNGLKHTSNDTYSNTRSSNAYILGWFMRSAFFWLFWTKFVLFLQGKEVKRMIAYHICVYIGL